MSKKQEIISFKVEEDLAEVIKQLPNRSQFIRQALLAALDSTCPLCQGTGQITQAQKPHLNEFLKHHSLQQCDSCEAVFFACDEHHEEEVQTHVSGSPG
ncbi:ribbon-helix-helix domain-containing protein [Salinispira pacifica]|uniref:CopG family transcriptional regulator n=1 Tax=Salinispira pacifica TaxID=1307761 RepID=V5WK71_9SPIO|nr:ribbon-helix-helix domain-containing protein [Salinispira pacifica]AHC16148.1 hypothetical protein L21SP2_2798 [Salinispira pacifica]